MPKFCTNGHQMEDVWTDCPYCAKTGFRSSLPGALGKTRPEMTATMVEQKPAFDPRKTVPLSVIKRAPVVGWLVVAEGPQKGEDFRLREGKNALGSAEGSDITLRDPAISSKHASINYREGKFTITDLDSTNGTFLNDHAEPLARSDLRDNDVIRIGETRLKFKCL